jgi:aldehyde dehydrogenase (NAD+)
VLWASCRCSCSGREYQQIKTAVDTEIQGQDQTTLIVYDTLDDAIRILNDVEFGLTASFFSNDSRAIARFIDECETGMIHVNHGTVPDSHMPFGGIKASGVGAYSVGPSASAFYTTEHSVYLGV